MFSRGQKPPPPKTPFDFLIYELTGMMPSSRFSTGCDSNFKKLLADNAAFCESGITLKKLLII